MLKQEMVEDPGSLSQSSKEPVRQEKKPKRTRPSTQGNDLKATLAVAVLAGILVLSIPFLYQALLGSENTTLVESGSMSHGDDSEFGVLDVGDIAILEEVDSPGDITTWGKEKEQGTRNSGTTVTLSVITRTAGKRTHPSSTGP